MRLLLLGLLACAATPKSPSTPTGRASSQDTSASPSTAWVLSGATVLGDGPCTEQACEVRIVGDRIVAVGPPGTLAEEGDTHTALEGGFLVPAFIDSHVHFSYLPAEAQMADGGIAAAVDLAAPRHTLGHAEADVHMLRSGPMLTAISGYPTQSWGRNGYGWELASAEEAAGAVAALVAEGAGVIKSPVGSDGPGPALLTAIGAAAAQAGVPFATHALDESEALLAAEAGATVLAHTPVSPLGEASLSVWSTRAVISTLAAFGGASSTVDNLRALRAAGATVLYGTDFGNTRTAGIDGTELALLESAGLDGAAIIAAGTSSPAAFWGLGELGSIAEGKRASLLWVEEDSASGAGGPRSAGAGVDRRSGARPGPLRRARSRPGSP